MWWVLGLGAVIVQLIAVYKPSEPPLPSSLPGLDKFGHAALFAAPVFCLLLAARDRSGRLPRAVVVLIPSIFVVHAVLSELIQAAFFVHRDGDPFDALADALGVGLGLLGAWLIGRSGRRADVGFGP